MPKANQSESVLHDWVHQLPFQQQALLLTGMRGPDAQPKYNAAKTIVRYLRGAVIKPAGNWDGKNDNDFMWGEYIRKHLSPAGNGYDVRFTDIFNFRHYSEQFFSDHDVYPHHFIMHLVHCAEVVGHKHPDLIIRQHWREFYIDACVNFHMTPETVEQMDGRLNDFGCGI